MSIKNVKHLAYTLRLKPDELMQLITDVNKYYYRRDFLKLNKDNSPKLKNGELQYRTITPSVKRLEIVQDRIQKNILSKIQVPDYVYGGVKGKDNIKNALKHRGKKYNFTTDLSNYFPSISSKQVYNMFLSNGFSHTTARILTILTTYRGKLPQGTHTSPTISNLVFVPIGLAIEKLATDHNITFTTFIDDLTFSSQNDFKEIVPQILELITSEGLKLSHNKTFYKTFRPIVTGVVVTNNHLFVQDNFKDKLADVENKSQAQIAGMKNYELRIKTASLSSNKKK
jgi:RNA-directed DNA polymerase